MCTKNTRLSKFNVHKEHTRYPSLMCTKRTDPPSLVCTQHIEVLQVQCALSAHRPSMCCGLALEDCISYPPPHDQCGLYQYVFLFYPNHQRTRAYIVEGARRYLTQCLLPLPASRHPRKMDMSRNKTKKDENSKYMVYMACSLFPLSAACGPEM